MNRYTQAIAWVLLLLLAIPAMAQEFALLHSPATRAHGPGSSGQARDSVRNHRVGEVVLHLACSTYLKRTGLFWLVRFLSFLPTPAKPPLISGRPVRTAADTDTNPDDG